MKKGDFVKIIDGKELTASTDILSLVLEIKNIVVEGDGFSFAEFKNVSWCVSVNRLRSCSLMEIVVHQMREQNEN